MTAAAAGQSFGLTRRILWLISPKDDVIDINFDRESFNVNTF